MARKSDSLLAEHARILRTLAHEKAVEQLRSGVKQRAATIPSGKRYTRRPKHGGWS